MTALGKRLALVGGGLALAIGAAEIAVRALGAAPSLVAIPVGEVLAVADPDLLWKLDPSAEGMSEPGLRGPGPESPKRRPRVLVIGDSVAHGTGLKEPDSIPRQLERELLAIGCDFEVLNGGVPGYDSGQEARALELFLPTIEPDLVIVLYCLNDAFTTPGFPESLKRNAARVGKQDDVRDLLAHARASRFEQTITRASHLARLGWAAWNRRVHDPMESKEANREFGHDVAIRRLGRVEAAFHRMRAVTRERGPPVVVAISPLFRYDGEYSEPDVHASVAALAEKAGLIAFDLLPATVAHWKATRRLLAQDEDKIHPNAEGAGVLARALAPKVAELLRREK